MLRFPLHLYLPMPKSLILYPRNSKFYFKNKGQDNAKRGLLFDGVCQSTQISFNPYFHSSTRSSNPAFALSSDACCLVESRAWYCQSVTAACKTTFLFHKVSLHSFRLRLLKFSLEYRLEAFLQSDPPFIINSNSG